MGNSLDYLKRTEHKIESPIPSFPRLLLGSPLKVSGPKGGEGKSCRGPQLQKISGGSDFPISGEIIDGEKH